MWREQRDTGERKTLQVMQRPFPSLCEINRWGWRSWERTKRQQGLLLLLPGVLKVIRSPISWLLLCFCAKRCQIKKTNEKKLSSIVLQECTKDCRNLAIILNDCLWWSLIKIHWRHEIRANILSLLSLPTSSNTSTFALFHFDLPVHSMCMRREAVGRWLCAKVLRSMKYLPKQ